MARPGLGFALLDRLDGPDEAKRRVTVCLQTLTGDRSVEDAMAELGISKQRFHDIRDDILRGAITGATPKPGGRPPTVVTVSDHETLARERESLAKQRKDMEIWAEGLRVREELDAVLGQRRRSERAHRHADAAPTTDPSPDGKKGRPTSSS